MVEICGSTWGILREWRCLNHSDSPPPLPNKHYWQVTDEDFERAIQGSSKATQNATQHLHVSCSHELARHFPCG